MINLVDASIKRDHKAARVNIILLTYCVIVAVALACVILLVVFSHWHLNDKIAAARAQQAANQSKTGPYASVKADGAALTQDLAKVQSVLTNRSQYATALLNIAASMPAGASVVSLQFTPTFVTTPLDITATTQTYEAAQSLNDKLRASPIYQSVKLNNVNCSGGDGICRVSITATLKQSVFTPGATE